MPSSTGLTGAAGEYYVAAELSRRDWLATVTIKNAPGTDVLAQRRDRRRIVAIQTKTSRGGHFRLSEKDEAQGERDDEWYVLVGLRGEDERPSFFVLPRHAVGALVYLEHRDWLWNVGKLHPPSRPGHERRENTQRNIEPAWIAGYADGWELLGGSAWKAPFLGDRVFLDLERELPLPEEYRPLDSTG